MASLTAGALLTAVLAACGAGDGSASSGEQKLRVATTVAPITSIVENIGGTKIQLQGLIPEGTNSHTFEPAPSVARLLSRADLIVLNGLKLEEPTLELAEANKKEGATILLLGDNTLTPEQYVYDFSFPKEDGNPNPHLWPNVTLAMNYAKLAHDKLAELDPANAAYYDANFQTYTQRLQALDEGIRQAVQTIPSQNRKLLTYHDSWAYFAERYGMTVIGAAQPSDFSEPSAREVADLIDQVKAEKVPAVFGSEVFPSPVLRQIAAETDAQYVDKLRDDDLPGKPGDPLHSYVGLMLEDMRTMIPALGGNVDALQSVDPSLVFTDGPSPAKYPQ
jgi:ABC-type Zn uptake system ZnuABC Zn-binding protein ZnuA